MRSTGALCFYGKVIGFLLTEFGIHYFFPFSFHQSQDASPAASQLATSVIQSRTEMLEPFVSGFLTSCIANRDAVGSELGEYYHEIIFKLFQSAPRMLLTVMPKLIQELLVHLCCFRYFPCCALSH